MLPEFAPGAAIAPKSEHLQIVGQGVPDFGGPQQVQLEGTSPEEARLETLQAFGQEVMSKHVGPPDKKALQLTHPQEQHLKKQLMPALMPEIPEHSELNLNEDDTWNLTPFSEELPPELQQQMLTYWSQAVNLGMAPGAQPFTPGWSVQQAFYIQPYAFGSGQAQGHAPAGEMPPGMRLSMLAGAPAPPRAKPKDVIKRLSALAEAGLIPYAPDPASKFAIDEVEEYSVEHVFQAAKLDAESEARALLKSWGVDPDERRDLLEFKVDELTQVKSVEYVDALRRSGVLLYSLAVNFKDDPKAFNEMGKAGTLKVPFLWDEEKKLIMRQCMESLRPKRSKSGSIEKGAEFWARGMTTNPLQWVQEAGIPHEIPMNATFTEVKEASDVRSAGDFKTGVVLEWDPRSDSWAAVHGHPSTAVGALTRASDARVSGSLDTEPILNKVGPGQGAWLLLARVDSLGGKPPAAMGAETGTVVISVGFIWVGKDAKGDPITANATHDIHHSKKTGTAFWRAPYARDASGNYTYGALSAPWCKDQ